MAIKFIHDDSAAFYFCTFTCFIWMPLIDFTNCYDSVYKWMEYLRRQKVETVAYVIMPNHVHILLYFPSPGFSLNKVIGNAKRFLAYEIIKRLKEKNDIAQLDQLQNGITQREKKKGQLHRVFEESFDAKPLYTERFFKQKIDYIHHNPVSGKWALAKDFTTYRHSSASFYETGVAYFFLPFDYRSL